MYTWGKVYSGHQKPDIFSNPILMFHKHEKKGTYEGKLKKLQDLVLGRPGMISAQPGAGTGGNCSICDVTHSHNFRI